jgi:hypothetical protein
MNFASMLSLPADMRPEFFQNCHESIRTAQSRMYHRAKFRFMGRQGVGSLAGLEARARGAILRVFTDGWLGCQPAPSTQRALPRMQTSRRAACFYCRHKGVEGIGRSFTSAMFSKCDASLYSTCPRLPSHCGPRHGLSMATCAEPPAQHEMWARSSSKWTAILKNVAARRSRVSERQCV